MDPRQIRNIVIIALVVILLGGSRTIAEFVIEFQWWKELGQLETWVDMLIYQVLPAVLATVLGFIALLWAHRRGLGFAGVPAGAYKAYSRIVPVALFLFAALFIGSNVDAWTIMAFVGSLGSETGGGACQDPVFGKDLGFYLFNLPFYRLLLRFLFTTAFFSVVIFWATGRG